MVNSRAALIFGLVTVIFQNWLLAQVPPTAKPEPMTEIQICDLFRRLDTFDGKRVAVRGVYRFSFELAGLYSEGCAKPLVLDGAERAQALSTEFVGKAPEERTGFAHFTEVVDGVAKKRGKTSHSCDLCRHTSHQEPTVASAGAAQR